MRCIILATFLAVSAASHFSLCLHSLRLPVLYPANSQNMLYPREGRHNGERNLVYICKACDAEEVVEDTSTPVYRNVVVHTAEYVLFRFLRAVHISFHLVRVAF
jgi:hypothetical protein